MLLCVAFCMIFSCCSFLFSRIRCCFCSTRIGIGAWLRMFSQVLFSRSRSECCVSGSILTRTVLVWCFSSPMLVMVIFTGLLLLLIVMVAGIGLACWFMC